MAIVCWSVLAVMLADAFRTGDHWPSDNLAGLLIGLSMVTIAHGVSLASALHGRCRDCPAQLTEQAKLTDPPSDHPGTSRRSSTR